MLTYLLEAALAVASLVLLYYRNRAAKATAAEAAARTAERIYRVGYEQQKQHAEEMQRQRNEWVRDAWRQRANERIGDPATAVGRPGVLVNPLRPLPSVPPEGDKGGGSGGGA